MGKCWPSGLSTIRKLPVVLKLVQLIFFSCIIDSLSSNIDKEILKLQLNAISNNKIAKNSNPVKADRPHNSRLTVYSSLPSLPTMAAKLDGYLRELIRCLDGEVLQDSAITAHDIVGDIGHCCLHDVTDKDIGEKLCKAVCKFDMLCHQCMSTTVCQLGDKPTRRHVWQCLGIEFPWQSEQRV